jgi:hypothetical protein
MKAYWGSGGIAPRYSLTSALDGSEWSASHSGHFTPRERAPGPQSRSGLGGEEKNSQPPPGIEPYNPLIFRHL